VVLSFFFQFFTMGKMVICSMYIVWKKFHRCQGYIKRFDFIYYNNIIVFISDNTHVLLISPINITHTTLKKTGGTELISTVRLTYRSFYITYESFSTGCTGVVLCTVKNLELKGGRGASSALRLCLPASSSTVDRGGPAVVFPYHAATSSTHLLTAGPGLAL
jgi:hypothetical protein